MFGGGASLWIKQQQKNHQIQQNVFKFIWVVSVTRDIEGSAGEDGRGIQVVKTRSSRTAFIRMASAVATPPAIPTETNKSPILSIETRHLARTSSIARSRGCRAGFRSGRSNRCRIDHRCDVDVILLSNSGVKPACLNRKIHRVLTSET